MLDQFSLVTNKKKKSVSQYTSCHYKKEKWYLNCDYQFLRKYSYPTKFLKIKQFCFSSLAGWLMLPKGMAEVVAASLRSLVKVWVASERESVVKLEGVGQWVSI